MAKHVTQKQIEFFNTLLEDKDFGPNVNVDNTRLQFSQLDTKSASAWVEKALALPDKPEGDAPTFVPPSF